MRFSPTGIVLALCLVGSRSVASALEISAAVQIAPDGGYPRATRLSNGDLLAVYDYSSTKTEERIDSAISKDNGKTWTLQGKVIQAQSHVGNQFPLQHPDGRILVAIRNHIWFEDRTKGYKTFRIEVRQSTDHGKTFQHLAEVHRHETSSAPDGMWEPLLRIAKNGDLQIYYSLEMGPGAGQDSIMRTSKDGGKTWSAPKAFTGANSNMRDGMLGVTTIDGSNSSKLIAVFETTLEGRFQIWSVTSSDDGATWGNRRLVYKPADKNATAGAPHVIRVGKTLVASFQTDEDATGARDWPTLSSMKVVFSVDGGANWVNKTTIFNNQPQTWWPSVYALDDYSFLGMTRQGKPMVRTVTIGKRPPTLNWFAFGDSYTTTGFDAKGVQPSPGNAMGNPKLGLGTSTGGRNYVGVLATELNRTLVQVYNMAYPGATTGVVPFDHAKGHHFEEQVKNFFEPIYGSQKFWDSENSIFSIAIGTNDIGVRLSYGGENRTTLLPKVLDKYFELAERLYAKGARRFMFVGVPALEFSPRLLGQGAAASKEYETWVYDYNGRLASRIKAFVAKHPDVSSATFDHHKWMKKALDNYKGLGFKDKTCMSKTDMACIWNDNYHVGRRYTYYLSRKLLGPMDYLGFDGRKPTLGNEWFY